MKTTAALRSFVARGVMKHFAAKYNLVYFGTVDAHNDEHEMVRGVTATTSHEDSNYTVGTIDGHDLIFVERNNHATHPNLPNVDHQWLILQIALKQGDFPHVFIDSHHDATFHSNLHIAHSKLQDVTKLVLPFGKTVVLSTAEGLGVVGKIITKDFVANASRFESFDYEIDKGHLFVYAHKVTASEQVLTDMLRVGIWVAKYLDALELQEKTAA